MNTSRLFWKLYLVPLLVYLGLVMGMVVALAVWQRGQVRAAARSRLSDSAVLLAERTRPLLLAGEEEELQELIQHLGQETGTRMTVMAPDGTVLADSAERPEVMENHADRPEFMAATTERFGTDERSSRTVRRPLYYLATAVRDGAATIGYVRVAIDLSDIRREVAAAERVFAFVALGIGVIGSLLHFVAVGRLLRPLEELTRTVQSLTEDDEVDRILPEHSGDEIGQLARTFNAMQRRRMERLDEFRQYAQRLSAVLSNMVEGVVTVDRDKRVLLVNDAARQMLQLGSDEQVAGHPLVNVCRRPEILNAIEEAFKSETPAECELTGPGTTRRSLALRATRLGDDEQAGVMVVLHDITELRRLENLRREFVANVSHELKTPLSSIKAYAETLRLGAIDDTQHKHEFVRRIEEQAERLHQLILDLLQIARIEAGQAVVELTELELGSLVASCGERFGEVAAAKNIQIELGRPATRVVVQADEEVLRTILDNLVDNAIKYTPEGGRIRIAWETDGSDVVLLIEDNGIGIALEDQDRVFERFYRVDKARSRAMGGTGLGLSIVKHLAHSVSGRVSLQSRLGEGSTFIVRFPARSSGHANAKSEAADNPSSESTRPVGGSPR